MIGTKAAAIGANHARKLTARLTKLSPPIAATMASSFGLSDARTLVLDHPIGGTAPAVLEQWADAATDRLVELFTRPA